MELNNFVIDRVLRVVGMNQNDDSVLFALNQVTNPSLNVTSETAEAVDAIGAPIAIFNRAKTCEFSAENSILDLNLMAAQAGSDKIVASADAPIVTPIFEVIEIKEGATTATLSKTPIEGSLTAVYEISADGTLGTAHKLAEGGFAVSGTTLTVPEGTAGQYMAIYEYNATSGAAVINSATEFPTTCKLVMEVLGCNVCDQSQMVFAYLIFNNFKLSPDFDFGFQTDSVHNFSGTALQNYCDPKKELYTLIIPA